MFAIEVRLRNSTAVGFLQWKFTLENFCFLCAVLSWDINVEKNRKN